MSQDSQESCSKQVYHDVNIRIIKIKLHDTSLYLNKDFSVLYVYVCIFQYFKKLNLIDSLGSNNNALQVF